MEPSDKPPSRKGRNQTEAPKLGPIDGSSDEPIEWQVYRRLRFGLMSGLIAPDTVLTGRSLAQQLEVSVQPVRDALKRLEAGGVLESRPQSGFYLRPLTQDEYREVTEIRQLLEGMAGHHAAAHLPREVLAKLHDLNQDMSRMSVPQDYLAMNFKIHFTIYRFARRAELLQIIQNLWLRIGPALHHVQHDMDYNGVLSIHNEMLKALENRDGPAVAAAICKDLASAAEVVVPLLPRSHPPTEKDAEHWLLSPEELP